MVDAQVKSCIAYCKSIEFLLSISLIHSKNIMRNPDEFSQSLLILSFLISEIRKGKTGVSFN